MQEVFLFVDHRKKLIFVTQPTAENHSVRIPLSPKIKKHKKLYK